MCISIFSLFYQMVDFSTSLKKIIPTTGESKVLLSWAIAAVAMFVLQYVAFAFVSGSSVSSKKLPVMRVVVLGAIGYAVLMMRDIVAYYAGVGVDEMFSMTPIAVCGIILFMTVFLLYTIHDIQDIGSLVATSSQKNGGNLFSLVFDNGEGFEEIDESETEPVQPSKIPRSQPRQPRDSSVSQYGQGTDPFTAGGGTDMMQGTRDKHSNQKLYDQRGSAGVPQPPTQLMAADGGHSGSAAFAPF